jgi:DHA1 family tetracycline resistance protein-like MFS transporter
MKRQITPVILFVFVDLLGYSLFLPLLPYYAENLGATPSLVGLLVASNALAQLIAAPIVGRLSDRIGRRPLIIFSVVGTIVSFVLLGLVEPLATLIASGASSGTRYEMAAIGLLFFTRALDGLAGGNASLARAYITDVTDEEERARGLGLIGAAFGLGFIIGPALGGFMSNWGLATSAFATLGLSRYAVPAFAAAGLAVLNLIGVVLRLPESLSPERRAELAHSPRTAFRGQLMWEALKRPKFNTLLSTRFLYSVAFTVFTANFALYTQYQLELADRATSYILAYVGVLVVLVQGLAIGRLTARYTEKILVFGASVLLGVTLLAWSFVSNVALLLVILAPLALSGGVLNTVTNSALTKSVYPEEVGGALGLSEALNSLARVIAPAAGGYFIEWLGPPSLGIVGAVIMVVVIVLVWRRMLAVSETSFV